MTINPFENAKPAPAVKKNGKKMDKAEVQIDGLRTVAALDAAAKAIEGLKKGLRGTVDAQILDHFVNASAETKRQPENFRGVEEDASASCELRKRSTRSPLNEVEVKILEENKIPFEEMTDRVETFIINPAYLTDEKLIARVGAVLAKVPGMPVDFIQKQEAVKSSVVSDDSLAAVFAKPSDKVAELLRIVGVIALKPKLDSTDLPEVMDLIRDLVADAE
jgi:hypothetical protein